LVVSGLAEVGTQGLGAAGANGGVLATWVFVQYGCSDEQNDPVVDASPVP